MIEMPECHQADQDRQRRVLVLDDLLPEVERREPVDRHEGDDERDDPEGGEDDRRKDVVGERASWEVTCLRSNGASRDRARDTTRGCRESTSAGCGVPSAGRGSSRGSRRIPPGRSSGARTARMRTAHLSLFGDGRAEARPLHRQRPCAAEVVTVTTRHCRRHRHRLNRRSRSPATAAPRTRSTAA